MNLEAQRKLKFDRRLIGRRGAATEAELAAELSKSSPTQKNALGGL